MKKVKTSAVLRGVRQRIKLGWDDYICLAIEHYDWPRVPGLQHYANKTAPEVLRAKRLIHTRMQMKQFQKWVDKQRICDYCDPYSYCEPALDWWLVWKGYVTVDNMPNSKQMREYRLAWLTALIEELEAKGE